ncbi:MAG: DUF669 domain-containing protein [Candidatus Moraniibacteriota bacterium]
MSDQLNWGALMDASGGAFEPLPKGTYDATVDTAEATTSTTGKVMFKIKYKVLGGPHNGRTIFNNITLTTDNPNALRMFFLNMKAMGLGPEYFGQNPPKEHVAASLVGKQCKVTVDHREYQGQMRENVKSLAPAGGAGGMMAGLAVPPAGIPTPTPVAAPTVASVAPVAPVAAPSISVPATVTAPVAPTAPEPVAAPPAQESQAVIPPPATPVAPEAPQVNPGAVPPPPIPF